MDPKAGNSKRNYFLLVFGVWQLLYALFLVRSAIPSVATALSGAADATQLSSDAPPASVPATDGS